MSVTITLKSAALTAAPACCRPLSALRQISPVGASPSGSSRRTVRRLLAAIILAAGIAPVATAQTISGNANTQELQRQQERGADVRLPVPAAAEPGHLPEAEGPCFPITEITLRDDTGRFAWALAAADPEDNPATGRCLGAAVINLVMQRVQDAIVARGYVTTRVLAEPQDLRTGKLLLTVVPGRIRAIRFSEESGARANAWNALPMRPGDLFNLRDIEQGLENFKRAPTAEADIQIGCRCSEVPSVFRLLKGGFHATSFS